MAAALEELINNIQEMVQEAWTLPLSSDKCVIERDRMLDLIDELRSTLPADIKMAADIVEKRNEMMAAGKRDLDAMRKKFEEEARRMVSETQIMQEARKKAREIVGNAEIQARELRRAAGEFCDESLKRTEESMALSLEELKKARARFKAATK